MSSADEVIAAIDEGKSHLEQASASFANAKQLAEQLSSVFAGLNADGKAAEADAVATILGEVESAVAATSTTADDARSATEAIKGGLTAPSVAGLPPPSPTMPGTPRAEVARPKDTRRQAVVNPGKFQYLLGFVTSGEHNTNRSGGMQKQFARLGIYNNPEGRQHLQDHFDDLVNRDDNVMRTYTDEYGTFEIRDSLFAGPCGFLHFESAWEITGTGRRLTTVIPKGGKRQ